VNDELLRLAERCEAATGPDRELDDEIARALGWTQHTDEDDPVFVNQTSTWWAEPGREWSTCSVVPSYTASLDAAMTLVPEGWRPIIDMASEEGAALVDLWALPEASPKPTRKHAKAATPALALCAAALRSHAHRMGEGE
jgi:hypothetical protein